MNMNLNLILMTLVGTLEILHRFQFIILASDTCPN